VPTIAYPCAVSCAGRLRDHRPRGRCDGKQQEEKYAGAKLWLSLYRANCYDEEDRKTVVPPGSPRLNPEGMANRWEELMSRHFGESVRTGLRQGRENLGLTQQELADRAGRTATTVAIIERGERPPNLDTAARLCWALDMAAGVTSADV
jgi:DNA-binding XRE family transcriptional regulator